MGENRSGKYVPPGARDRNSNQGSGGVYNSSSGGFGNRRMGGGFGGSGLRSNNRWDRSGEAPFGNDDRDRDSSRYDRQPRRDFNRDRDGSYGGYGGGGGRFNRDGGDRGRFGGRGGRRGGFNRQPVGPPPKISSRNATFSIAQLGNKPKRKEEIIPTEREAKTDVGIPKIEGKLSEEQISGSVFKIVKDFLGLLQKNVVVDGIKNNLRNQNYEGELFEQLFDRSKNLETRDKKAVVDLLLKLRKEDLISATGIAEGIDSVAIRTLSKSSKTNSHEEISCFQEYFKFLESSNIFEDVKLSGNTTTLVKPLKQLLEENEEFFSAIVNSELRGSDLKNLFISLFSSKQLSLDDEAIVLKRLFDRFLEFNSSSLLDENFSLFERNEFGDFLETVLKIPVESENKEQIESALEVQTEFLYSLEKVFYSNDFPLTEAKESLFEICLIKLFQSFLEEDSILYWRDDKFRITTQKTEEEKNSKRIALTHCNQVLDIINQQEDDSEIDSEEEDEE